MWTAWSTAQFSVCTFCSLAPVMLLCTQSSDQSSSKGQCHICVDKGAGKHVPFPHSCDTPRGLTHTNLRYHLVTHFSAGRGDGGASYWAGDLFLRLSRNMLGKLVQCTKELPKVWQAYNLVVYKIILGST